MSRCLIDANSKASSEISVLTLHRCRPFLERRYVWPFLVLYAAWLVLVVMSSGSGFNEAWLILLALIGLGHFIAFMSGFWSVDANVWMSYENLTSSQIADATFVRIVPFEHRGKAALCPLLHENGDAHEISFTFQQVIYQWNPERKVFSPPIYPDNWPFEEYSQSKGHTDDESWKTALARFGPNQLDLPLPTFSELFREHAVAPFFVFQVGCVGLWCLDEYWYYSLFTLFMLVVFESTVVQQRLKNLAEFRSMSLPPVSLMVHREGRWSRCKSDALVPGDLVLIPDPHRADVQVADDDESGFTVPCDLVLLDGSCVMNEAMISGESTPLLKESIKLVEDQQQSLSLDIAAADKTHVLFGGTKILQMTSHATIGEDLSTAGCLAFVARTGFGSLQGQLIRTMIYGSEQMTANNRESFAFILFLLVFAVAAAAYVLVHGWNEVVDGVAGRSRYKLLLEAALIITAVVPPELPMELSLAVNSSLVALSKFAIFCMEPFRIPIAGKLDVLCFDKTGTLTAETLQVEGIVVDGKGEVVTSSEGLSEMASLVIGTCQALFPVKGKSGTKVVGDPMEMAAVQFAGWTVESAEAVAKGSRRATIISRFPFSSALKRMSCVIRHSTTMVVSKGAPEVMKTLITNPPSWYEHSYETLARSGARVIALAHKSCKSIPKHREEAESGLTFDGFLVFRCPLKQDSKAVLRQLSRSNHRTIMITGDNLLTAIYTSKQLGMLPDADYISCSNEDELTVEDANGATHSWKEVTSRRPLPTNWCLTGGVLDRIAKDFPDQLEWILPRTIVFARASPVQKEFILTEFKRLGLHTLMCGDGTNDVGALKQAHIGVALLDGKPEDLARIQAQQQRMAIKKRQAEVEAARAQWQAKIEALTGQPAPANLSNPKGASGFEGLLPATDEEGPPLVRLGDASVAAPFTSKIGTIEAVANIIRQGRCTLVTTIQMYKILALNSLISAYSLSVLHLAGIRYGDFQVTVTGMLLASCFLFLTRAQPIKRLARERPQTNIFNYYLIGSVLGQFALHIGVLVWVMSNTSRWTVTGGIDSTVSVSSALSSFVDSSPSPEAAAPSFTPSLINTAVYLVSLLMQVSTFVVNYQGRPFRESLWENRPLRNALAAVAGIAIVAALQIIPEFNEWLQLVPMPPIFQRSLCVALAVDFWGCVAVEALMYRLFFSQRSRLDEILEQ